MPPCGASFQERAGLRRRSVPRADASRPAWLGRQHLTQEDSVSAAYNTFEKLRDPSHGTCLSLDAWQATLEQAGFTLDHAETLDQDIEFAPWSARMRCDAPTEARLRDLLADDPLRSLLRPRDGEGGLAFTLQEAIMIARKPV